MSRLHGTRRVLLAAGGGGPAGPGFAAWAMAQRGQAGRAIFGVPPTEAVRTRPVGPSLAASGCDPDA
jgi:hypothetical protein